MPDTCNIKKGVDVNLDIESLAFGGMGIAYLNNCVTFVKNAIPGQKVNARITKKRSSYLEARCLEVLNKSPYQVKEPCKHFSDCGGCTFQNLDYEMQIAAKKDQVENLFQRIGNFKDITCQPILGCDVIFNYRNKMEFTFSNKELVPESEKREPIDYAFGLHAPNRWDKIININECHIQSQLSNEIFQTIRKKALELKLEPYDIKEHKGFLRNVVIRVGTNTGEVMINIATTNENKKAVQPMLDELIIKFPQITSVVNNITTSRAGISMGEHQVILFGNDHIIEKLGNYEFIISADSFFQTNTRQAEKLYEIIIRESKLTGKEIVYDLFCGTGSIALYVSNYAKMVYGFEIVMSAVQDAMQNAIRNKVNNTLFFLGDIKELFRSNSEVESLEDPDVMIIDPPRSGLHANTIKDILNKYPKRIIYVSCNPSTQARDVELLCREKYELIKLSPIDMFPHTPHIENVATLIQRR